MSKRHDYFCAALTGLCQGAYIMNGLGTLGKALGTASSTSIYATATIVEFAGEIADAAVAAEEERTKSGENLLENQS